MGCHFLLQGMKVKSEVTQSCPTLCDPVECSLPGSSVHGIFQARVLEWGAIAFSETSSRTSEIEDRQQNKRKRQSGERKDNIFLKKTVFREQNVYSKEEGLPGGSVIKNPPGNSASLGWEDPLEKALQDSCLGNPTNRGTWWAMAHGAAKESNMTRD